MKDILYKNKFNMGTVQVHMKPPPIPLNKSKNNEKLDKFCVKIRFREDPMSQKLVLYEFKKELFDNSDPEDFLLFIRKF